MNRYEYINYRSKEQIGDIIYIFYKKACADKGISPLPTQAFLFFYNQWKYARMCAEMILNHYDVEFEILEVSHPTKGVIAYC